MNAVIPPAMTKNAAAMPRKMTAPDTFGFGGAGGGGAFQCSAVSLRIEENPDSCGALTGAFAYSFFWSESSGLSFDSCGGIVVPSIPRTHCRVLETGRVDAAIHAHNVGATVSDNGCKRFLCVFMLFARNIPRIKSECAE